MKPLLNVTKNRYIAAEDSFVLHRLKSWDEVNKFYWTICGKPIAHEERYLTFNYMPNYGIMCDKCGPF